MRQAPERDQFVELFRIIAAFGIVAFHTKVPQEAIPYAGLIFFLILSPYYEVGPNWTKRRSLQDMAVLFLIPLVFWQVVYGAMNLAAGKPLFPYERLWQQVMGGSSLHLWFLPVVFVALVTLSWLKTWMPRQILFWVCLVLACAQMGTVVLWYDAHMTLPPPAQQWIHALPALLIGIVLGTMDAIPRGTLIALPALAVITGLSILAPSPLIAVTYPIGITGVLVALYTPRVLGPLPFSVQTISSCAMGVYVSHIVWVRVCNLFIGRELYLTAVVAFVMSVVMVWAARRYIPKSRLVLG